MSLDADAPVLTSASFRAMGTTTIVVVDDARAMDLALGAARATITAIDRACSRFQHHSELSRVNRAAGRGPVEVSELLNDAIGAAIDAAAATGGLVDPTIGKLMERVGYTVTFNDVEAEGPPIELEIRSAPGWASVIHNRDTRTLELPEGASLDLGAVGKAWAADRAADAASRRIGAGALVACGGDVAVAGPSPVNGWHVRVAESTDAPEWQDVHVFDGGLATSGTRSRTWRRGGQVLHHILDPSTGLPADSPWSMASVAAVTCAQANAAAITAIILGERALPWLEAHDLPSRLVRRDGSTVTVGPWPAQAGPRPA